MRELRVQVIVTITELDEDFKPVENSKVDGFKVGDRHALPEHFPDVAIPLALADMMMKCNAKSLSEIESRWNA